MTAGEREIQAPDSRRPPVIFWPVLLAFLIGAAFALIYLERGEVSIPYPTADIAAYERIDAADLAIKDVRKWGLGESVVRNKSDLIGRMTRKPLSKGSRIDKDEVTSKIVTRTALEGLALKLRPSRASAFGVQPGDRVDLRLAPTGDGEDLRSDAVRAVLLDVLKPESGDEEYVVSVHRDNVDRLLNLIGRSVLFLVPAP